MTWVKHSDDFSANPKVIGLSDKAYRLHFCALEYCARHLTDGVVTKIALRSVAVTAGVLRPNSVVNSLVKAGLWHKQRGAKWAIHDYLEYNPTAAEVKEERRKAADRMRNLRRLRSGGSSPARSPARSGGSSPSPSFPEVSSNEESPNGRVHVCPECELVLKTKIRLLEHRRNVHGVESELAERGEQG